MGKKKVGKQRKDKFYQLAKETGYRSRAAFKLIQLNRKFEFLAKSRVLVDLCAAPGGWMQVASQYMPVSSLIIGVDLFPIKPIPRTVGLTADITTDSCRQKIRKELQSWKADVVLCDGAPNIGRNWIHDAFKQNELVLSAMKLAADVLNRGGWFVTKAFRSKDYPKLLSVAKTLFEKVHATKPRASRQESAEIFVVCQNFIGSDRVPAETFDPKIVFQDEVSSSSKPKIDFSKPEGKKTKKPKAEGYPESQPYVLYSRVPVSEFLAVSGGHLDILASASTFHFDDDPDVASNPLTTQEIKDYCTDLKVLGRSELRTLLSWRKKLLAEKDRAKAVEVAAAIPEKTAEQEEEDEEEKLKKQIAMLKDEERRDAKRKLKKIRKLKRDYQRKLDTKMVLSKEEAAWESEVDAELFQIKMLRKQKDVDSMANLDMEEAAKHLQSIAHEDDGRGTKMDEDDDEDSDEEEEKEASNRIRVPDGEVDERYIENIHHSSDEDEEEEEDDVEGDMGLEADSDSDSGEEEDDEQDESNRILVDLETGTKEEKRKRKADDWFSRDVFQDGWTMADEDIEGPESVQSKAKKMKKDKNAEAGSSEKHGFEEVPLEKVPGLNSDDEEDDDLEKENQEVKKKIPKLDAVGLAIGAQMIRSAKTKRDMIENSWNRYAFNETDGLPEWFVKDEQRHFKKPVEVSSELLKEYQEKLKAIDARPIKKVAEAKARKKKRAKQRMDKARKKAEAITENEDMTEREKSSAVKQIYRKAVKETTKKKEVKYIVSRRFQMAKKGNRPSGSKRGPYKIVDPRMKKDNRAEKKQERKQWNRVKRRERK